MEQLWYHQMLSPDHNWISQKACQIGSPNLWLLGTEFTLQRLLSLQLFELVTLYADPWDRCSVLRSKRGNRYWSPSQQRLRCLAFLWWAQPVWDCWSPMVSHGFLPKNVVVSSSRSYIDLNLWKHLWVWIQALDLASDLWIGLWWFWGLCYPLCKGLSSSMS